MVESSHLFSELSSAPTLGFGMHLPALHVSQDGQEGDAGSPSVAVVRSVQSASCPRIYQLTANRVGCGSEALHFGQHGRKGDHAKTVEFVRDGCPS